MAACAICRHWGFSTLRIVRKIQCFNDEFANLSNGQRVVLSHSWFSFISWPTYRWYFKQPSFKYWFLRRVCQHQPISHWTSVTWSFPCWIFRNCPRMPETGAVGRWLWWINLKLAAESSTLTTKEGDIEESIWLFSGTPKWMVYNGIPIKMDDLGVPSFLETSISIDVSQ